MKLLDQPSNLATFICGHLFRSERPIRYVNFDLEGDLSMVCGQDDCEVNDIDNCKLVGLGHMLSREPKFRDLEWLPSGFEAYNDPAEGWVLTALADEKEEK